MNFNYNMLKSGMTFKVLLVWTLFAWPETGKACPDYNSDELQVFTAEFHSVGQDNIAAHDLSGNTDKSSDVDQNPMPDKQDMQADQKDSDPRRAHPSEISFMSSVAASSVVSIISMESDQVCTARFDIPEEEKHQKRPNSRKKVSTFSVKTAESAKLLLNQYRENEQQYNFIPRLLKMCFGENDNEHLLRISPEYCNPDRLQGWHMDETCVIWCNPKLESKPKLRRSLTMKPNDRMTIRLELETISKESFSQLRNGSRDSLVQKSISNLSDAWLSVKGHFSNASRLTGNLAEAISSSQQRLSAQFHIYTLLRQTELPDIDDQTLVLTQTTNDGILQLYANFVVVYTEKASGAVKRGIMYRIVGEDEQYLWSGVLQKRNTQRFNRAEIRQARTTVQMSAGEFHRPGQKIWRHESSILI